MVPSVGTPRRGRIVPVRLRCSLSTELTWTGEPDGPCAFAAPSPWSCLLSGVRGGSPVLAQTVSRKLLLSGEGPVGRVPGVCAGRGLNDCVVLGGRPGCGFVTWPGFTWNRSVGGMWGAGGASRAAGPLVTGAGGVRGRGRRVRRGGACVGRQGSSGVWGRVGAVVGSGGASVDIKGMVSASARTADSTQPRPWHEGLASASHASYHH